MATLLRASDRQRGHGATAESPSQIVSCPSCRGPVSSDGPTSLRRDPCARGDPLAVQPDSDNDPARVHRDCIPSVARRVSREDPVDAQYALRLQAPACSVCDSDPTTVATRRSATGSSRTYVREIHVIEPAPHLPSVTRKCRIEKANAAVAAGTAGHDGVNLVPHDLAEPVPLFGNIDSQ